MAIVNDKDEYMGTVSLKRITDSNAEFAIVVRKCAMGKGYSKYGMKKIMKYGFDKIGLEFIGAFCQITKGQSVFMIKTVVRE